MEPDLESDLDRLYGVELDQFVRERDALARELREAGRKAEAARVKELRKPAISAWAVNQLTRRNRKDVDLLLDAGHRLREAQKQTFAGEGQRAFEQAREIERKALRRLTAAAEEILGRGSGGVQRAVATMRAAAVSDEGRELLARGRLDSDVEPAGLDLFQQLAAGVEVRPRPPAPTRKSADAKAVARARDELRDARERAREATARARSAEREAAKARAAAADAEDRAARARSDAEAADEAVTEAERRLDEAKNR